jgi:hypothetical protein
LLAYNKLNDIIDSHTKGKIMSYNKEYRREKAIERQELRNKRSHSDQLAVLDNMFGVGLGAKKERERLALLISNKSKPKKESDSEASEEKPKKKRKKKDQDS